MTKNKHKQLANLMQQMIEAINVHVEQVRQQVDMLQLYFFEKYYILGRPLMPEQILKQMAYSHKLGLQYLSPHLHIRQIAKEKPLYSVVMTPDVIFASQIRQSPTVGWHIPWGVKTVLPQENNLKLHTTFENELLYCSHPSEISKCLKWFEVEDATNSFTHQLLEIGAYFDEQDLLKTNLLLDPIPVFYNAIKEWQSECEILDINEKTSKNEESLFMLSFAPLKEQTLALAYERVLKSRRERMSRHRQNLRKRYREKIERLIFQGLHWSEEQRKSFLMEWECNFFNEPLPSNKEKAGRWEQSQGISRANTFRFIKHFVFKFIEDPDDKRSGEIACILWILLWCAQESDEEIITVDWVCNLTSKNLHPKRYALYMHPGDEQSTLGVSKGLHEFLLCLQGDVKGATNYPLFTNISQKTLSRELHKASEEICAAPHSLDSR